MFKKKDKKIESENKNIKKIDKKVKNKKVSKNALWIKKTINLYEDIFKLLETTRILKTKELQLLLEDKEKWYIYTDIEDFLDDINKIFWEEKENEILTKIFKEHLGYNVELDSWIIEPDFVILNLFKKENPDSLLSTEKKKILEWKILPLKISQNKKINKLVFVSRNPWIPKNLLNTFKSIIDKEKILDGEIIIVNKSTFNNVIMKLQDEKYDIFL